MHGIQQKQVMQKSMIELLLIREKMLCAGKFRTQFVVNFCGDFGKTAVLGLSIKLIADQIQSTGSKYNLFFFQ